ncbi:undecaprenyl-phosphate glucose phosphotransferase [Parvularcula maris]|uniref:Undecaprenyl-phosphate glucose phosphotransferase n=1 Tax=Parvularcula maris TaxID=2965077 RepID=A0A9X2L7L2_9PROT|nr:undecaprenyl-phosphate glucose phosphotransferase [Parvularcula maris]MCQ8184527.1 undecaprenyl-phosphate glucose phosphotransferase [Parvularcula maris]
MSITATDDIQTGPRRRRGISRDVCADLAALLQIVIVTSAAVAATPFATLVTLPDGMVTEPRLIALCAVGFLTSLVYTEALRQGGYFRFDQLIDSWGTVRGVVWRFGLIMLSFVAACYSLGLTQFLSRGWLIAWALMGGGSVVVSRFVMARILRSLSKAGGLLCRRLVFVGNPSRTHFFSARAVSTETSVEIVRSYEPENLEAPDTPDFLGLQRMVEGGMVDDIIVCPRGDDTDKSLAKLLDQLRQLPVHVSLGPHPLWVQRTGRTESIGKVPTYVVQRRPISGWDTFTKMLEDRILSFLMLLALSPVMLACAIAVRLDSKGPIFFVQRRQGMAGDIFPIMKFRSMRVMEDGDDVKQATKDDDRITKVGAFLRKTSLDELPQLINVLRGQMSLVGPRPHALKHDAYYSKLIKDYAARHRVKPGMTGWAQVNGFRGETNEPEKMEARLKCDLEYIENWSLWFDLRILVLTVKAVLKPENAY